MRVDISSSRGRPPPRIHRPTRIVSDGSMPIIHILSSLLTYCNAPSCALNISIKIVSLAWPLSTSSRCADEALKPFREAVRLGAAVDNKMRANMRVEQVEILSDAPNRAVLRHPGRHFPGLLV